MAKKLLVTNDQDPMVSEEIDIEIDAAYTAHFNVIAMMNPDHDDDVEMEYYSNLRCEKQMRANYAAYGAIDYGEITGRFTIDLRYSYVSAYDSGCYGSSIEIPNGWHEGQQIIISHFYHGDVGTCEIYVNYSGTGGNRVYLAQGEYGRFFWINNEWVLMYTSGTRY